MEANHSSESGTKTLKLPENEDRISALPDPLIHHILSFLPSTKQSIQTSILSKRWRNQWAHVPVLIFESESSGMSSDDDDVDFARFIDNTLLLYECSKMKKLHIAYDFAQDTNFNSKLRFAMRKDVEVLCLDSWHSGDNDHYRLPKFIFENASLVELQIYSCDFDLSCRINWSSLKALKIENCFLGVRLFIENVLSGSPSLGSLELENFNLNLQSDIVIASKSLKILILKSFELYNHIEISCPNIEELSLKSFNLEKCKLMNLPSSCCATLDLYIPSPLEEGCAKTLARKILKDLQAIKEVAVGNWFLELLSAIDMRKSSYPLLNIKCLTLDCHDLGHIVGIVNALRCSPALERLVLNVYRFQHRQTDDLDLNNFEEAYLDSNVTDFTCFMSNLKMVKIVGLSNYGDSKCQVVLQFLKFLLKNAKALEKMVVILDKDGGTDFLVKVSKKLLSFPRVSQHAIVELL